MMVQFCSNSVTGTMIAPALALVWVLSSMGSPYASRESRQHGQRKRFAAACDPDGGRDKVGSSEHFLGGADVRRFRR